MDIKKNMESSKIDYSKYINEKPFTKWKLNDIEFYMESRYEPYDITGQGTFGVVVACQDKEKEFFDEDSDFVAIKKIERAFEHTQYAIRTIREIKLQRMLTHENIIPIYKLLLPKSRELMNDIYLVEPLMTSDLRAIINSQNEINEEHIQFLMYQIIRGLKYMHSAQIVHRDLKPKNVLSNEQGDLKICDFGFARHIQKNRVNDLSEYVTARWYRAPEILLSYKKYDIAVDMWSCGIIMAELLKRQPIIRGASTDDQMRQILQLIGSPDQYQIKDPEYKKLLSYFPYCPGKNFKLIFPNASSQCLDLLKKLLQIDPSQRITAEQALAHPFFEMLHDPSDEPDCEPINQAEFEYENYDLNDQQLKDILYEEILLYNSPEFREQYYEKLKKGQSVYSHIIGDVEDNDDEDDDDDDDDEEEVNQNKQIK
ncbi:hypothetical protein ABPG74_019959 [Tetrahymena malaccensis]